MSDPFSNTLVNLCAPTGWSVVDEIQFTLERRKNSLSDATCQYDEAAGLHANLIATYERVLYQICSNVMHLYCKSKEHHSEIRQEIRDMAVPYTSACTAALSSVPSQYGH